MYDIFPIFVDKKNENICERKKFVWNVLEKFIVVVKNLCNPNTHEQESR